MKLFNLTLYRKTYKLSNLINHATEQLTKAGLFDDDADYGGELGSGVLELIELFASQGHSGTSAEMTIQLFERLARFKEI